MGRRGGSRMEVCVFGTALLLFLTAMTPAFADQEVNRKPSPPHNVEVKQEKMGLRITWDAPHQSPVPMAWYQIYYRTVGPWVPLSDRIVGKTSFLWTTSSRGATYTFKVYAFASDTVKSSPSTSVRFYTGVPAISQGMPSGGTIAGIVVGALILLVILLLAPLVIRFLVKKRFQKKGDTEDAATEANKEDVNTDVKDKDSAEQQL